MSNIVRTDPFDLAFRDFFRNMLRPTRLDLMGQVMFLRHLLCPPISRTMAAKVIRRASSVMGIL